MSTSDDKNSYQDTPRPKSKTEKQNDDTTTTPTSTDTDTDTSTTSDTTSTSSPSTSSTTSASASASTSASTSPSPSTSTAPADTPRPSDPGSDSDDYGSDDSDDDEAGHGHGHGHGDRAGEELDSSDDEASGIAVGVAPSRSDSLHNPLYSTSNSIDYSKEPLVTLSQLIQHDEEIAACYQEFNPADEPWIRQQLVSAYEASVATSRYVQLQSDSSGIVIVVPAAYGREIAIEVMNNMLSQGMNGRITARDVRRAKGIHNDDIDFHQMISFQELIQNDEEVSAVYARLAPTTAQHEKLLHAFITYAHRQPPSHSHTESGAADSNIRLLKSLAKPCVLHVIERLRLQAVRALQIQVYSLEHAPPPPSSTSNDIKILQNHIQSVQQEFEDTYITASKTLHRLTQPLHLKRDTTQQQQQHQQQQQLQEQAKETFDATS